MIDGQQHLHKVIIDTDAGHDDILAMIMLMRSQCHNILALTTVAGNSVIRNVTRNAFFLRRLVGRSDIPIYAGYPDPLERKLVPAVIHGKSGLDGVGLPRIGNYRVGKAPGHIISLVKDNPGQISILAIGPLSNIARAFSMEPKLPYLIRELIIMGGAIGVAGNKNRVAEFNMAVDPEAANIVFQSSVKKILVPLNPCNDISIQLVEFGNRTDSPLGMIIYQLMTEFAFRIKTRLGTDGVLVYDALAAYYLINPTAFTLKPMDIVIETKGEHTFGMIVPEQRYMAKKNANVYVVESIDGQKFRNDFLPLLGI